MSEQTHVFPQTDAKPHVISLTEPCWCEPHVLQEAEGNRTLIHTPLNPVVEGHQLNLTKQVLTDA